MGAGDGGEIEGRWGQMPGIAFSNEHEPQIFRATDPKIETVSTCHVPKTTIHMASKTGDFEKRFLNKSSALTSLSKNGGCGARAEFLCLCLPFSS